MAVSDLNIRLGIYYRKLESDIKKVEGRFKAMSDRLSGVADTLSVGLTLPILGFGAAAIKAAGDMESLRLAMATTMKDAGYSVQQTAAELEALRKIALAPGIDFEQAVKGSIRLQNVGISAENARNTLAEVANAIAAAGGSAENLNSVTIQLAQMHAKGVVMASDLRVIQESMPGITKAMQDAFGQSTAEGIRDAGISAEQFIQGITAQLAKNSRVTGGIANAINNAQSAFKQFFATIGDGIVEAYGLSEQSDKLYTSLSELGAIFRNLDPETKKAILNFALYAAAIGPAIKVLSLLYFAGQKVVAMQGLLVTAFKSVHTNSVKLVESLGKMSTAMKFTYVGAAIAIIAGLYLAFQQLNKEVVSAMHVTTALNEVQKKATEYASQEIGELTTLKATIESNTASNDQRKAAIDRLQQLYPEYFKNLNIEKLDTNALSIGYDKLRESILKTATARAAGEKLNEIAAKQLEVGQKRQAQIDYYNQSLGKEAELRAFNNAATQASRDAIESEFAAKRKNFAETLSGLDKTLTAYQREADAVLNVKLANEASSGSENEALKARQAAAQAAAKKAEADKGSANATKESAKALRAEKAALKEDEASMQDLIKTLDELDNTREQLAKAAAGEKNRIIFGGLEKFRAEDQMPTKAPDFTNIDVAPPQAPPEMTGLLEHEASLHTAAGAAAEEHHKRLQELSETYGTWVQTSGLSIAAIEGLTAGMSAMAGVSEQSFSGLFNSILGVEGAYKNMGVAALSAASDMVRAALAATIAKAIQKSFESSPNPIIGIILGGVAVAGVNALFGKINQSLGKAPKLAKGGLAYGPTMAMVGDNRGASVDPEVIAPLSKLRGIMGSASQNVRVTGEISGRNIAIVQQRWNYDTQRKG